MKEKFKKIGKISIYFLVFLFPLFFLPFSADNIFYPKEILFYSLLTLSLFSWFLGVLLKNKLTFLENWIFYFFFFLLLFFVSLSTIFSLSKNASFWGFPLEKGESFLFLFFSIVFLFLFSHLFEGKSEIFLVFLLVLISSFFLSIFSIFQIYYQKTFLGLFLFNPFGPLSNLSIFFAILLPIALSFLLQARRWWKLFFGLCCFLFLFFLIISGVKIAYFLLFWMMIFLLIFSIEKKEGEIDFLKAGLFSLVLILSIFFYFFPLRLPFSPKIPLEVSLNFSPQVSILKGVFSEGIKNVLLGTGPGTFLFDYSKYRPLILNNTIFWGTRFSFGSSTIFDWLITKGIFATISLVLIFLLSLNFIFKKILRERKKLSLFQISLFASLFGLIVSSFFYSFNLSLWFFFWLFLGAFLSIISERKEINFSTIPFSKAVFFVVFFLLFSFSLLTSLWQSQKYLANVFYKKGIEKISENLDLAITNLEKATKLNSEADFYWRELSQLLLLKANQISQEEKISLEEKKKMVGQVISEGISAIEKAVNLSPVNVSNWNVRGYFYRNLIGIEGAGEIAIESYRRAIYLEPSSPYSYTEMGRVYILKAQEAEKSGKRDEKEKFLSLAKKRLEEAIEKKSDYAPAHYLLAVVASQEGREKEAIAKLEETRKFTPSDLGVSFQLALLYYRTNQFDKAETILKETLEKFPNYSNARYLLGLVYDQKGEKEKAKAEFKNLSELNPDNQEVKKILENLEKGLSALEGILTPQTLSEEKPKELQP